MRDCLQVRNNVGGKKHNFFLRVPFQNGAEVDPLLGVQPRGRLVQNQNIRVIEQCLGDAQPAAHPAGKSPELFVGNLLQPNHRQQPLNLRHSPGAGHPFQHSHIQKEITGAVLRIPRKILRQISKFVPVRRPQRVNGDSIQTYLPGSRFQNAADHPQKSCFPRPIGPQQAINAGFQHSGDACHRRVSSRILAQIIKQQLHR